MADDRSIWIAAEADRARADNEKTVVAGLGLRSLGDRTDPTIPAPGLAPDPGLSFEDVFVANYPRMRASLSRRLAPGVAVFAASALGVHGEAWIAAVPPGTEPVPLVIGRHGCADLFVPIDAALSLRHVLAVARVNADRRVRTRIVDLRSDAGLYEEAGRRLYGAEADGPIFLTAARMRLFFIPTPLARFWPEDGREAWRELPPRTTAEVGEARPRAPAPEAAAHRRSDERSPDCVTVTTFARPIAQPDFCDLLVPGERPLGWLLLRSWRGEVRFSLGARAMSRGVLLGRYERCESRRFDVLRDDSLSRVHALLLDPGDGPRLFDTGSTNHVVSGGSRRRVVALDARVEAHLGTLVAEWTPAT